MCTKNGSIRIVIHQIVWSCVFHLYSLAYFYTVVVIMSTYLYLTHHKVTMLSRNERCTLVESRLISINKKLEKCFIFIPNCIRWHIQRRRAPRLPVLDSATEHMRVGRKRLPIRRELLCWIYGAWVFHRCIWEFVTYGFSHLATNRSLSLETPEVILTANCATTGNAASQPVFSIV